MDSFWSLDKVDRIYPVSFLPPDVSFELNIVYLEIELFEDFFAQLLIDLESLKPSVNFF